MIKFNYSVWLNCVNPVVAARFIFDKHEVCGLLAMHFFILQKQEDIFNYE